MKFATCYPCRLCTVFDSVLLCLWYWKLIVSFILLGYKIVFGGVAFISIISKLKARGIFRITINGQFLLVQCTSLCSMSQALASPSGMTCQQIADYLYLCSYLTYDLSIVMSGCFKLLADCSIRLLFCFLTANMFRLLTFIIGLVMC